MKPILHLSIPKPCREKWETFTPSSLGGFCDSCNTVVVDFTKMSDKEISGFFENKPVDTCGRFRPSQLKTCGNWQSLKINPGLALLRAGLLCLLFVLIDKQSFAQDTPTNPKIETVQEPTVDGKKASAGHIIRGIVKDDAGDPIPGVNVYLKDATVGTVTDANGRFEFPRQLMDGERLTFSFIGFESIEYAVSKAEEEVVELSMTLEVGIMGEVTVDQVYTTEPAIRRWWSGVKKLF
jgi:hypothetical protein